jgi:hypothetical protein
MTITKITSHNTDAISRLLTQFREKPKIEGIISTNAAQYQDIEDAGFDMLQGITIEHAIGATLDRIGDVVGLTRGVLSDDDFRVEIRTRISQRQSYGRVDDIITGFKLLTNSSGVLYGEIWPAGIYITGLGNPIQPTPEQFSRFINSVKPAGVALVIASLTWDPCFSFDGSTDGEGFGDHFDGAVGGHLASLI